MRIGIGVASVAAGRRFTEAAAELVERLRVLIDAL